jgi:hypothetical protein
MRSLADVPVRTGRSSKAYTAQTGGTIRYIVVLAALSALYNRMYARRERRRAGRTRWVGAGEAAAEVRGIDR